MAIPAPSPIESSPRSNPKHLGYFGGAILLLAILRLVIGFLAIPSSLVGIASIVVSILFIAIPIGGFYAGAAHRWSWLNCAIVVLLGAAVQLGFFFAGSSTPSPAVHGVLLSISQSGLLLWCFGLGAALAGIFRDRNLIVPVAIFLALFDIWLVFAPAGTAHQAVSEPPSVQSQMLHNFAFQVPQPENRPRGGFAQPLAYVGPADLLFIPMFFVLLFRFRMRTRQTLVALIPTMALYLLVVLLMPNAEVGPFRLAALPALVPIGAVILAVNWKEFKLSRDELISTLVILILGLGILTYIFATLPEPQPEPSPRAPGRALPAPANSPEPIAMR